MNEDLAAPVYAPDPRIAVFAGQARRWVEQRWQQWRDLAYPACLAPLPVGLCGPASIFLREVLGSEFPGMRWFRTGGETDVSDPECIPGGMVPLGSFRPEAHSWVQGEGAGGRQVIVDITADQFGHDPVIVAPVPDRRYRRTYPLEGVPRPGFLDVPIGLAWAADFSCSNRGADMAARTETNKVIAALRAERERFRAACPARGGGRND
jgi:hypothetical protein